MRSTCFCFGFSPIEKSNLSHSKWKKTNFESNILSPNDLCFRNGVVNCSNGNPENRRNKCYIIFSLFLVCFVFVSVYLFKKKNKKRHSLANHEPCAL